jgi:hypothetical protein
LCFLCVFLLLLCFFSFSFAFSRLQLSSPTPLFIVFCSYGFFSLFLCFFPCSCVRCSCVVSPPNFVQPWLLAPIATWHTLYRVPNTLPIASWVSSSEFPRLDSLPLNSCRI